MSEQKYFHKWSGLDSEFNDEAKQIKKLTKILKSWADETKTSTHLLTNFTYNGEEIDVTIILPTHYRNFKPFINSFILNFNKI